MNRPLGLFRRFTLWALCPSKTTLWPADCQAQSRSSARVNGFDRRSRTSSSVRRLDDARRTGQRIHRSSACLQDSARAADFCRQLLRYLCTPTTYTYHLSSPVRSYERARRSHEGRSTCSLCHSGMVVECRQRAGARARQALHVAPAAACLAAWDQVQGFYASCEPPRRKSTVRRKLGRLWYASTRRSGVDGTES